MNTQNDNAHLALHGIIAALVFCGAVTVFFHVAPYHEIPATAITAPPADCLPSGANGPCIPFNQIIQRMQNTPEAAPANPTTPNEEEI
jgi:hypothetical protein